MDRVTDYIERQEFKDGDRIPTERDLSDALGVSRRAVRRALDELEVAGRIWRGRRNGTFWGCRPATVALGIDRRLRRAKLDDILEARLILEPAIAALAATKASSADLKLIHTYLQRSCEAVDDDAWFRWDSALHLKITESTGNEVFVALVTALNASRADGPWRRRRIAASTAEKRKRSLAHHRRIVDALHGRLPEKASEAMRSHILAVGLHMFG